MYVQFCVFMRFWNIGVSLIMELFPKVVLISTLLLVLCRGDQSRCKSIRTEVQRNTREEYRDYCFLMIRNRDHQVRLYPSKMPSLTRRSQIKESLWNSVAERNCMRRPLPHNTIVTVVELIARE